MTHELTIELTDWCPYECAYCSSMASPRGGHWLSLAKTRRFLRGKRYTRINLSGGEPLAHPDFWRILQLCHRHAKDVVVYTNALTHIRYNSSVIDGIYIEANITLLPETSAVHILKRVEQGREARRPEISFSRNWAEECSCGHRVLRPDGTLGRTPCNKYTAPTGSKVSHSQSRKRLSSW